MIHHLQYIQCGPFPILRCFYGNTIIATPFENDRQTIYALITL